MCIKTMIKIALCSAIAYCSVGVAKHVVCMIKQMQSKPQNLDGIFEG